MFKLLPSISRLAPVFFLMLLAMIVANVIFANDGTPQSNKIAKSNASTPIPQTSVNPPPLATLISTPTVTLSPSTTPAPQETIPSACCTAETTELQKLTEIEKKVLEASNDRDDPSWLSQIDKAIDATLAATLAGLVLAAAAFLISYREVIAERLSKIAEKAKEGVESDESQNTGQLSSEDKNKILNLKKRKTLINDAVKDMIKSFRAFIGLLVVCLLIDSAINMNKNIDAESLLDLALSAAGTGIGIFYMFRGSMKMFEVVSMPQLNNNDESGAIAPSQPQLTERKRFLARVKNVFWPE